jgi:transposase
MVYSIDLRQAALNYIANGGTRLEASKIFGVTIPTLANWLSRQKQQDLAPKMNGSKPSKIGSEKLRKYIELYPDSYLREIAAEFNSTLQAVFYACKRLNITLKKTSHYKERDTKKREAFQKELETIAKKNRV